MKRYGCDAGAKGAGMGYSARREECAYIADAGRPTVHKRDETNAPRARLETKWGGKRARCLRGRERCMGAIVVWRRRASARTCGDRGFAECRRWRESYGDARVRAASQRRKKREARSRALRVELVLLWLWVCKCRSRRGASAGGVAVAVADELALGKKNGGRGKRAHPRQVLPKQCGARRWWHGNS